MCHLETLGLKQNFNSSDDSQGYMTSVCILVTHYCLTGIFLTAGSVEYV